MGDTGQAVRDALEQALRDKDESRFKTIAFVHRHEIIAALANLAPEAVGEAVAVIGKDWQLLWASADTLSAIVEHTGIKIGSPLYAHPTQPPTYAAAHIEAQDAEIDRLHGILKAVISDTRGPLVGGGDGGTFIVRPISGETYNKIHAALKGAKP